MEDRNLIQLELTCDQAAFVVEALAAKCDSLHEELRTTKWELDAAKRKMETRNNPRMKDLCQKTHQVLQGKLKEAK